MLSVCRYCCLCFLVAYSMLCRWMCLENCASLLRWIFQVLPLFVFLLLLLYLLYICCACSCHVVCVFWGHRFGAVRKRKIVSSCTRSCVPPPCTKQSSTEVFSAPSLRACRTACCAFGLIGMLARTADAACSETSQSRYVWACRLRSSGLGEEGFISKVFFTLKAS